MSVLKFVAYVFMGLAAAGTALAQDINPVDWHRQALVFEGYDGAATLTNFPALVVIEEGKGGFAYDQMDGPDGADLRFLNAEGTAWLPYEVERWDPTGRTYVWVRVPELAGTNTLIWALWGNPAVTQPPSDSTNGAAWASVYDGVWHLSETNAQDSSGHAGHFTAYDGPVDCDGPINRGLAFNGACRLQTAGARYEYAGPTTVEYWMRSDDASNQRVAIGMRDATTRWSLHQAAGSGVGLWNNHNYLTLTAPAPLATGQWYHVAFVDSGVDTFGTTAVYLNGAHLGTMPESFSKLAGLPLVVGNPGTTYGIESWIGGLDEIRIAPAALPADWFRASWLSQVSNDTFVTWQSAVWLANGTAANISPTSADLTGVLQFAEGTDPLDVWLYWGTNDAGRVKEDWNHAVSLGPLAPGAIRVPVVLPGEDTYTYRFYASNTTSEIWAEPSVEFISGAVTIVATQPATTEGSGVAAEFTVSRPAACARDALTVAYTLGGTADNGVDCDRLAGRVVLPAGETNAVIAVMPLLDDDPYEAPQTVRVTLAPGAYVVGQPDTAVVTISEPGATDVPNQWAHRMRIDLTGYTGTAALTNFPALVVLNESVAGFRYDQCASPAGGDLRFVDGAQSRWLSHDVEAWRPGTNSYVWVRVPELAGTNTSIWALWGNPSATNPPAYTTNGITWRPTYAGVWHLSQTNAQDSSTNRYHCTARGINVSTPLPNLLDCPVGDGLWFNGTNRLQTAANRPALEFDTGSIEFWMRPDDTFPNEDHGPVGMQSSTLGGTRWAMFVRKGITGIGLFNGTQSPSHLLYPFARGAWYHVTLVQTNGNPSTYVNGVYLGAVNRGFSSVKGVPLMIGAPNDGGQYFIGAMDEVRLSPVALSADWIRAGWLSQSAPGTFLSPTPMIANADATGVAADSATLNGTLNWDDGVPTAVWVYWGANDAGRTTNGWEHVESLGVRPVGRVSAGVALPSAQTYYYRYYASNAVEEVWSDPAAFFIAGPVTIDAAVPGRFTVRRPVDMTRGALPVNYTVSGSASNGVDYLRLSGRVTIADGATSAAIPVVMADRGFTFDAAKQLVATLAPGGYIVGAPDVATLAIHNHPGFWGNSLPVTFTGYSGTETLRNFPVPLVFSEGRPERFRYRALATPGGADLRFSDGAQTRWLAYEIDEWNTGGQSRVWVQVPELAGTNTTIWAHWGNALASVPPAYTTNGATWSENYQAVLHFAENNGTTSKDSSPNRFTGSLVGEPGPAWEAGKLGTALRFDGTDDRFETGRTPTSLGMNGDKPKTSEAWVKVEAGMTDDGGVFSMGNAWPGNEWTFKRWFSTPGWVSQHWGDEVTVVDGATAQPDPYANWVHVAHTYTPGAGLGQTVKIYVNGVQAAVGGPATLAVNDLRTANMGCWWTRSWQVSYFKGWIDEGRLSNAARSADWIKADWESQRDPAAFATYGTLEVTPTGLLMLVR